MNGNRNGIKNTRMGIGTGKHHIIEKYKKQKGLTLAKMEQSAETFSRFKLKLWTAKVPQNAAIIRSTKNVQEQHQGSIIWRTTRCNKCSKS